MQCSEADNITRRFWESFASGMSILSAEATETLKRAGFPDSENGRQFALFLEVLRKHSLPCGNCLFVFDDAHLITEKAVLGFLEQWLNARLSNINSLLISRYEPAVNMERLESRKLLARITEDDLRFSQDETISYFKLRRVMPGPRIASAIYQATEGWPFAVHLAGLSLKGHSDAAYVLHAVKSNAFKLIESEIVSRLSEAQQRLLIKLSLVKNISLSLVREIGGEALGESLIAEIERMSSFIRYDSGSASYRVHGFFMDYLREQQGQLRAEEKKEVWV